MGAIGNCLLPIFSTVYNLIRYPLYYRLIWAILALQYPLSFFSTQRIHQRYRELITGTANMNAPQHFSFPDHEKVVPTRPLVPGHALLTLGADGCILEADQPLCG